jgi:hypothetical protein
VRDLDGDAAIAVATLVRGVVGDGIAVMARRGRGQRGRPVMRDVADTAAFGTNATAVRAPGKGRYLVRLVVRATNGTTGGADALLVIRPPRS